MSIFIKKEKIITIAFFTIIILWYLFCSIMPSIKTPETCSDEISIGIGMYQFIHNLPSSWGFKLFGKNFPSHNLGTHGAMEYYLLLPFVLIGGINIFSLRIGSIFWGIFIIFFTYLLCKKMFNKKVGFICILLLATNSYFIELIKQGNHWGFSLPFFSIGALYMFYKWHVIKKNVYFYIAMFFLALGLNVKFWNLWFIVSLTIYSLLFYLHRRRIQLRTILIGIILFIIGLIPIVYCDIVSNLYRKIVHNNLINTAYGANNINFVHNLKIRAEHLHYTLYGVSCLKYFPIIIFWTIFFTLIFLIIKKNSKLNRESTTFFMFLFLSLLIASTLTFTTLSQGHLIIFYPYTQILFALGFYEVFNMKKNIFFRVIIVMIFFILVISNITRCLERYKYFSKEYSTKKDCNIELVADWLLANKSYDPYCMHVSSNFTLLFFSNFKINENKLKCGDWLLFDQSGLSNITDMVLKCNRNDIFVFDFDYGESIYEQFKTVSEKLNKTIIIKKAWYWPHDLNRIRFLICSVE